MKQLISILAAGVALVAVTPRAQADAAGSAELVAGDPGTPVALATIRVAAQRAVENAAVALGTSTDVRGRSGGVHAVVLHPGSSLELPGGMAGLRLQYVPLGESAADTVDGTPVTPGIWSVLVRSGDVIRKIEGLHVFTSVPLNEKRAGRIGAYRLGDWPGEGGTPVGTAYSPPSGVVRVEEADRDVRISDHLRLGDLLTKGQNDVWPKYLVLDPRALDKVELTLDALARAGRDADRVGVISGFRTPWYNANGGSTAGRGSLSRHMYGDAIDLYVDHDGDGRMDDLNRDGRIDRHDAAYLAGLADEVEAEFPELTGGVGIYSPRAGAHAGFVHIDARGNRARW